MVRTKQGQNTHTLYLSSSVVMDATVASYSTINGDTSLKHRDKTLGYYYLNRNMFHNKLRKVWNQQ